LTFSEINAQSGLLLDFIAKSPLPFSKKIITFITAIQPSGLGNFVNKIVNFHKINPSPCSPLRNCIIKTLGFSLNQITIVPFATSSRAVIYVQFEHQNASKSKFVQYKI